MAYDPRLDNNYRISGDRIISERQAQNEAVGGLLAEFLIIPPKLQFVVGILGFLFAAGLLVSNFPNEKFDSVEFWFACILGGAIVLTVWLISYALAPIVLLIAAVGLTYYLTGSVGLSLLTLIVYPILAYKITKALERMGESRAMPSSPEDTAPSARPVVGRGVKIFAAVTLASLALLIAWAAFDTVTHRSANQHDSQFAASLRPTASVNSATSAGRVVFATSATAAPVSTVSPPSSPDAGNDTVRAFYSALGQGDGTRANALLVLEKRAAPSYQPDAIEAFYGHMAEPLELQSVSATGAGSYEVRYRYRKQSAVCNGRAIVSTRVSDGGPLIALIRPIGNC